MGRIKKSIARLFSGEAGGVFRGMVTILLGAGLARILGLLSIPLLTRLYDPQDFGVLALYTSFVVILAPVLTLRYVQAIPLPKTDLMAFNLFSLCIKLIVIGALAVAFILYQFGEAIMGWFNMEALIPWRWLIVLGVAGTALYELFSLWATRKQQYKTISKTQIAQSLAGNLTKIGLGLLAIAPAGLIVGQFFSQSAGVVTFLKASNFRKYLPLTRHKQEFFLAKYYRGFVWFRLPSQLLMVLSVQAPVMMMAAIYDEEATGQFSLAIMALSLPVGLIGSAMAKAYYAEVAAIGKNDIAKIKRITFSVQAKLFTIGLPVTVIGFFAAEPVFTLVFGEAWRPAGVYAAMLSPYMLLQFTSSPLVQVLNVVGSQLHFLLINLSRMAGLLLIMVITVCFSPNEEVFVKIIGGYLFCFYLFVTISILIMINRSVNDCKAT